MNKRLFFGVIVIITLGITTATALMVSYRTQFAGGLQSQATLEQKPLLLFLGIMST